MNKANYADKIKKDLNNRKYYKKLDYNNIDNIINEKQLLINQIKDYLMDDSDTCTPPFYGLPKIHKEYENFPPLNPIAQYDISHDSLRAFVSSNFAGTCSEICRENRNHQNRWIAFQLCKTTWHETPCTTAKVIPTQKWSPRCDGLVHRLYAV